MSQSVYLQSKPRYDYCRDARNTLCERQDEIFLRLLQLSLNRVALILRIAGDNIILRLDISVIHIGKADLIFWIQIGLFRMVTF